MERHKPRTVFINKAQQDDPLTSNVVIVGSSSTCLKSARVLFAESRCIVTQCVDMTTAFEYIHKNREKIDLIILDIIQSEAVGLNFFRQLKSDKNLEHICVALQVSSTHRKICSEFASASGYIQKPYKPTTKFQSVRRILMHGDN